MIQPDGYWLYGENTESLRNPLMNTSLQSLNYASGRNPRLLRVERQKACSFVEIRKGATGSFDVANEMKKLVRTGSIFDKGFERWAVNKFVLTPGLSSYNPQEILAQVYDYTTSNIRYVSDERGIEDIKSARQTLSDGFGDCDDIAIFIATILSVLGFEPEFVLAITPRLVKNPKTQKYESVIPNDYNHVYVRVSANGEINYLDATLIDPILNGEATTIKKKIWYKIWNDGTDPNLEGLAGIGDFFKGLLKVAAPVVGAIPVVGQFAQIGVNAANAALNKPAFDFATLASQTNQQIDVFIDAVRNKGADYSEAVHQAEAVVNNFIGLNNNKGKKDQKAQNQILLDSITTKLNYLKTLKPENLAAIITAESGGAVNADGSKTINNTGSDVSTVAANPALILGIGAIAIVGIILITKD